MRMHVHLNVPDRPFRAALVPYILLAVSCVPCRAQSDSLAVLSKDFGLQYIFTDNVEFVTVSNESASPITIFSASVESADTALFNVRFTGLLTLNPEQHSLITVVVHPMDTLHHTTVLTVISNASDSIILDTLGETGMYTNVTTIVPAVQAFPETYISVPVIIGGFFTDSIDARYIASYNCEITYDPVMLTIDTSALALLTDSLGVSSYYTFVFDTTSRPGDVKFHAIATQNAPGVINTPGDTIVKIDFIVSQPLVSTQSEMCITLSPDSLSPFARYYSSCATFTMLPCSPPGGVYEATAARLQGAAPNPFNESMLIQFDADHTGFVNLAIYDADGKFVRSLVDGIVAQGGHVVAFDGTGLPSGMYACRLTTPISSGTQMIMLTR